MKEQQRNEIKVGLTIVVGLAILLFGFSTFKNWSIGTSDYTLRMQFPTSAGLATGDQVTVNGVRAGRVESVILRNGGVEVHANISSTIEVKATGRPVIQMVELMGGKKIEIRQGSEGSMVSPDMILQGTVDPDIAGALGLLGDMQGNIREIGTQADTLLRGLNTIVADERLASDLKQTISNLHAISQDLRSFLARNNENIDALTVNMVSLTERVDTMLAELQPAVGDGLRRGERVLENTDALVTEVRGILTEIRDSRGMLHTIIHDKAFVQRMDAMLGKLDTLSDVIIKDKLTIGIRLF